MTDLALWNAKVDSIAWAALRGAYGPSIGEHDVALALKALRAGVDDGEAMALMMSHCWHQGSVYDVTAAALPFLIDIARETENEDVCRLLALIASTGMTAKIEAAFRACEPDILTWDDRAADIVLALTPALRHHFFARFQPWSTEHLLAIARIQTDHVPADIRSEIDEALATNGDPAAAIASYHLTGIATPKIRALLAPRQLLDLEEELQLFQIAVPKLAPVQLEEWTDADVVLASKYWLRVRAGEREHLVRWSEDAPCGASRVRVAFASDGSIYAVEYDRGDGSVARTSVAG